MSSLLLWLRKADRKLVCSLMVGTLILLTGLAASAQDLPDVAQGFQPYASYHGGDIDSVNLMNGALTIKIPVLSYPQKGRLALSFSLYYNSVNYQDLGQCTHAMGVDGPVATIPLMAGCTNRIQPASSAPWTNAFASVEARLDQRAAVVAASGLQNTTMSQPPYGARYYVLTADGAQHPLAPSNDGARSVDQSGYLFVPTSPLNNVYSSTGWTSAGAGYLYDAQGVTYGSSQISDPDQNVITLNNPYYTPLGTPITDSVGRPIPSPSSASIASCPQIGAQNQPLVSAQSWTPPASGSGYLFCYATIGIRTHLNPTYNKQGSAEYTRTVSMLQSVVLPNGTYWGFIYDSDNPSDPAGPAGAGPNQTNGLGELNTILLPTGGAIKYTYTLSGGNCTTTRLSGLVNEGIFPFIPQVATRTKVDKDGTILGAWTYNISGAVGAYGSASVFQGSTVTSQAGDTTVAFFQNDGVMQVDGTSCGVVDAGEDIYPGPQSGTPLKSTRISNSQTQAIGWPAASANRVMSTTTTLDGVATTTTSNSYSATVPMGYVTCDQNGANCSTITSGASYSISGPSSTKYVGYSGETLKVESTDYLWQGSAAYRTANLISLPSAERITDDAGTTYSSTSFGYDEGSYSPGGIRGHQTTLTRSLLESPSQSPTIHTGWNLSGMKSFLLDADANAGGPTNAQGHTADYSYGCSGSTVTGTSNALNQHTSGVYDCNTGLLTSFTDQNGNTTAIAWDSMRRLTGMTYPAVSAGTPTVTFSYLDSTNTVQRLTSSAPDPTQTVTVQFDGFGRERLRALSDNTSSGGSSSSGVNYCPAASGDSSGGGSCNPIFTQTQYDALGRVWKVSNPYRSADPVVFTTSTYDALGRKTLVTEPDGNTLQFQYAGSAVDSYDERLTHYQRSSDALGRLTQVIEPGGLPTTYSYNQRGDLVSAYQAGATGETPRNRSFHYDSLSRLITATNPETGTVCYGQWDGGSVGTGNCTNGYDPNGNLRGKTDAAGTFIGYNYDALNRIVTKYSPNNDDVTYSYYYDQGTNGIGRLSTELNQHFGTNQFVAGTQFQYDAMGRVSSTVWGNYVASQISGENPAVYWQPGMGVQYDLAGNVTQLTYPDGRVVSQLWNSAGRLSSVNGGALGTGGSPFISNIQYFPTGAVQSQTLGNSVTETTGINSRLQVCSQSASNPAFFSSNGGTFFARQIFYGSTPESNCGNASGNNGNIYNILEGPTGSTSQSFSYDGLNRLTQASSVNRPASSSYSQQFAYDSFGNMRPVDLLHTPQNYGIDAATNRLTLNGDLTTGDLRYNPTGTIAMSANGLGGYHTYWWTPEGYLRGIDNLYTGSYLYDSMGERTLAVHGNSGWDEYVYLDGQVMGDLNSDGTWTDMIYANGQKIAHAATQKPVLHMHGTRSSQGNLAWGVEGPVTGLPDGVLGAVIQNGDTLAFSMKQTLPMYGGIAINFQDGTGTGNLTDSTTGTLLWFDGISDGQWHHYTGDLSSYAGEAIKNVYIGLHNTAPQGTFDVYYDNAVILHSDGSVTPIFTGTQALGDPSCSGNPGGALGMYTQVDTVPVDDGDNVNYYLADHLGTTQMELSKAGWPVWQGWFTPFGQEIQNGGEQTVVGQVTPDGTNNRFKFTGKERDTESGLDYFGARYYASTMGRFLSPDWAAKATPVPYAKLDNPQSLNLYAYVLNNPLSHTDPDGHIDCSGKNAAGAGCQAIAKWNSDHGISPTALKSNFPGVPVKLPNGSTVPDSHSPTGVLMAPTSSVSDVAAAGKQAKADVEQLISLGKPTAAAGAMTGALAANVGTGGKFDDQRMGPQSDVLTGGFQQLPQFRDVSNFNVGLFAQQAGMTLEDTLSTAGSFAKMFSSNYSPNSPYGLAPQTAEFIKAGYQAGATQF